MALLLSGAREGLSTAPFHCARASIVLLTGISHAPQQSGFFALDGAGCLRPSSDFFGMPAGACAR